MPIDTTALLPPPPNGLKLADIKHFAPEVIAEADRIARHWYSAEPGPLRPGTPDHREATSAMFRETFNPYKPSIIDWPHLTPEARDRLINLPIWDIAVQTEGKARLRMLSYARQIQDPSWHAAIEQNGWEEGRHKVVLSNLVEAYGITLKVEPEYIEPKDTEWAYLVTGFSECIDSFFAFGLFELARRSAFFPEALVDTFEPVIQEETRHILLFANWLAAHRASLPWWRRIWFEARVVGVWFFLGWERIGIARGMEGQSKPQDRNFTVTGSQSVSNDEISVPELFQICLEENARRFAGYDTRLLRPTTVPFLARIVVWAARGGRRLIGRGPS